MKTAVLIYGEFREFENAHKTWDFLKNFDYDVYMNTWDITSEVNENLKIDMIESVNEEKILKYFPHATINIERCPPYSTSSKTVYHWKKLFKLMIKSGKEYDNVILLRCDLVIKQNTDTFKNDLLKDKDDQIIYCLSTIMLNEPPVFIFVQDLLFFGKTNIMIEIFLSFSDPDITRKDIHYHLGKHFINNDIHVKSLHPDIVDYFVMRHIHRNHLNMDFESQKKLSNDWWTAKHKNIISNELVNLLNLKRII